MPGGVIKKAIGAVLALSAIGAASASAHGQLTTSTATAAQSARSGETWSHTRKTITANASTTHDRAGGDPPQSAPE